MIKGGSDYSQAIKHVLQLQWDGQDFLAQFDMTEIRVHLYT